MIKLRRKQLKNGNYSLYLDIYLKETGKRYYEFLNMYLTKDKQVNKETLRLAEAIRGKKENESYNLEHGYIPTAHKKTNFVQYFERIRQEKNQYQKSSFYNNTYKHLNDFTGGDIQISAIDEKWLKNFSDYLHTRVKHNSVYCYFNCLKAVLNRAIKDKIIQTNPFIYFDSIKQEPVFKTYLTQEELQTLANSDCSHPEIKRAFLFGCYTGLRISDITILKWGDIQDNQIKF